MKDSSIASWIVFSLILGVIAGVVFNDPSWNSSTMSLEQHSSSGLLKAARFFGISIFLAALKVLIVPLVAATVFVAVARIGVKDLGRLGVGSLIYYMSTMLIAVLLGIALVSLVAPGVGLDQLGADIAKLSPPKQVEAGVFGIIENLSSLMLPTNVLSAMAKGQTLSVICFFIFFGIVTSQLEEKAKLLIEIGQQVTDVLLRMVQIVLYLAPLGVFCLIFDSVAQHGLSLFTKALGGYVFCVLLGLLIHAIFVLPLLLKLFSAHSFISYFTSVKSALLMAFGTASSSATLPVSLRVANAAGIKQRVSGVVLPLGSTVNMDGTALYEAVAVIFLAQLSGVELGIAQLLVIAFTATLAAIGAAGIPSAGLVTLFIVVDAVNASLVAVNPGGTMVSLAAVGLILGVDRILDMFRTAVNVWGDLVGAAILDNQTDSRTNVSGSDSIGFDV